MRITRAVEIALVPLIAATGVSAQQDTTFTEVDRIAAVVGETAIPMSRVLEEVNTRRQQGWQVPNDSAGFQQFLRSVLNDVIDQELLYQAAQRDTMVVVSEQDVQSAVDRAMSQVRSSYASQLDFERDLRTVGFGTIDEYRQYLGSQQRRDLTIQQFMQRLRERGELTPLAPTEAELRDYFERTRDQQPRRPAQVSFRQIVVRPQGDSAAIARAYALADSLAGALRDGADFATVARRFSQDPGTAEQGGELGWMRRGVLVPEFERVAFDPRMRPGVVSPPVKTVYGFHLIQVERREPAEVQVRHILIVPEITDADLARAEAQADTVAQALRSGASFDSLSTLYHDQAGQEQTLVEDYPRSELPQTYRDALATANPGDVIGPILLQEPGRPALYTVVVLDDMKPEGEYTFEEVRDQLREQLASQNAMERYLRSLRRATYTDVRF